MRQTLTFLLAAAGLTAAAGIGAAPARAETTLEVVHAYGAFRERFYQPLADAFMKEHPDIKIKFRAPAADYYEGHLAVAREAMTGQTPDVFFAGMNLLHDLVSTLAPRNQITDMAPFLDEEGQSWVDDNYDVNVLELGRIDKHQWGLPFNASTPIAYFNADLMKKAGLRPQQLPKTWDDFIEAAKKIKGANSGVDGMQINLASGDWFWQAMVYSYGGTIMSPDRTQVTYGDEAGLKAATTVRRLVDEVGMPWIDEDAGQAQFAAGKLGIFIGSTGDIRSMDEAIGGKFKLVTGTFPMGAQNGNVPTGGNFATILTQDPEKHKAAWEFIKFLTSPVGQKVTVLGSGYMPTNKQAMKNEYLGKFYEAHPDWKTSLTQWPIAVAWFGYPNVKSIKVWKVQSEILFRIGNGDVSPADGLKEMVQSTEAIIKQ
ncbi:ABC transporter substrate-binding protein [Sinorhizobium meliloti]|uniref:ABC transporter substrate-binding protein n=1 Tax=Rhizobium meliloti TaxID=382 RepID=UPI0003704E2F|nr:ABC transporter substrate-binding protein [Sinorhizobium meliloti]